MQVLSELAGQLSNADLEKFFDVMSPRYLLNTTPKNIVKHIGLVQSLYDQPQKEKGASFVIQTREDPSEGCWEATFLAQDRPGLFSNLAGVLTLNHINILSAHIYTWRDGTAVDIFKVSSPMDPIRPERIWAKIQKNLSDTFEGRLSLEDQINRKENSPLLIGRSKPLSSPRVVLDNASSDFFTLIEVFAHDRVGFLYQITRTLFSLGLDIRIAKISTKADLVADVFYVRDREGQKVEDSEQILEIKMRLLESIVSAWS